MRRIRGIHAAAVLALVLAAAGGLQGCAGAGLTLFGAGAGVAAGTGVSHTLNGIAYKTFTTPLHELEVATNGALKNMGMTVERTEDIANGRKIVAQAEARTIEIELERLSPEATRMRVTAIQDVPILRDSATATEIILQTASVVDERREQRATAERQAATKAASAKRTASNPAKK